MASTADIAENRNTNFMTWNPMHRARMLNTQGGVPAHGNQQAVWDAARWLLDRWA